MPGFPSCQLGLGDITLGGLPTREEAVVGYLITLCKDVSLFDLTCLRHLLIEFITICRANS